MKRKIIVGLIIFGMVFSGVNIGIRFIEAQVQGLPKMPLMTVSAPRTALSGEEIKITVTVKNTIGTRMYDGKVYIDTLMIPEDVLQYIEIIVGEQKLPHLMDINDEATVTLKIKTSESIPAMRLEIPIVLDVMEGRGEGGLVPFVSDPPKYVYIDIPQILGKLSIVSDPSATVYINEEKKGTTPLELELDPGKYEIKIEKENYETYTETIEISSGETKTISVNLTKITPAPTTSPPTTTPKPTTSAPTTSPPTTTAPPQGSSSLLYIGIFGVIVVLVLAAYYLGKKKK